MQFIYYKTLQSKSHFMFQAISYLMVHISERLSIHNPKSVKVKHIQHYCSSDGQKEHTI